MKKRVLILCTGNSCRSQMAEAFLRQFRPDWEVESAGTKPADSVHPLAVKVMAEKNISMEGARPKMVDEFLKQEFSIVVTVCDSAKESCPVFTGSVAEKLHIGFDDPAEATGPEDVVLQEFRRIRDEIERDFRELAER